MLRQTPAGLVSCRSRPWGCTLQGRNPLTEPLLLSEAVALLRLPDRAATVPGAKASTSFWEMLDSTRAPDDGATYDQPHCRALLPVSVCTSEPVVYADKEATTLLGFILPRGFPLCAGGPPRTHPLVSFTRGAQARPWAALQSFGPAKRSAGLPRACRPLQGLPTSSNSPVDRRPDVANRGATTVASSWFPS